MDGPDLIVHGAPEPASPRRRRAVSLLAALLALVVVAVVADQVLAARESGALLKETTRATATAAYAERRVLAVAGYSAPALFGPDTPAPVRASLLAVVQREAAGLAPSVRSGASHVREVRVLPWHRQLISARAAAAGYVDARADVLVAAGQNLDVLFAQTPATMLARQQAEQSLFLVVRGADADRRIEAALSGSGP